MDFVVFYWILKIKIDRKYQRRKSKWPPLYIYIYISQSYEQINNVKKEMNCVAPIDEYTHEKKGDEFYCSNYMCKGL